MNDNGSKEEGFIALLSVNQRKIYSYILASVGKRNIADEIMQQALLVMWRDFSHFKSGTNFSAWGKEIAKYEIFNYRKSRIKTFCLDAEALEKVMQTSQQLEAVSDQRMEAMQGCLKKLSEKKRSLIYYRYNNGYSCIEISEKMNCPVSTVYKTFVRIHTALQDCIRSTLAIWDAQS